MINENVYIAVDLGAGSGRVFLCEPGEAEFLLEEIHRFTYPPREESGHLRWDFLKIFAEIKTGLKKAARRAQTLNRKIHSIGVDSWAVDYGLLDERGNLLADPVCYRDSRTDGAMEKIFAAVPRPEIFERTGIQFLNFNTIFQFSSEGETLEKADRLLLLPDLINYFLTGTAAAEYTNATTTQLVNAETGNWDFELLEKLNLPKNILPGIVPAGTDLGFLKPDVAAELNLEDVRLVAPATHDTGSAVAGAPLEENWAYISSGTWSLVGVERDRVLIGDEVARENFTNEGGVFGTIRFLKNVMGLWIFESCRKEWQKMGFPADYETLLEGVGAIEEFCGFIFPDDPRFLNPPDMLAAIAGQLKESGQRFEKDPVFITKIILDSLAFRYASVIAAIEKLTDGRIAGIQIIGGGGRNDYLNRMTATASGKPVKAGLVEATVTGNCLVQAIVAGRFADLPEARRYVAENVHLNNFAPLVSEKTEAARGDYARIERGFLSETASAKT
ncbi:MAG: rhamnulokinase family protein [Pyrinomonadaceae bacterium]